MQITTAYVLDNFNPEKGIIIYFSVNDIFLVRPDLTESEAMTVLREAKKKTENEFFGIDPHSLRKLADQMFPIKETETV